MQTATHSNYTNKSVTLPNTRTHGGLSPREPSLLSTRGSLGRRGTRASSCTPAITLAALPLQPRLRRTAHTSRSWYSRARARGLEAWRHGRVEAVAAGRGSGGGWRQGVLQRDHAGGLAGQAPCQRLNRGETARERPINIRDGGCNDAPLRPHSRGSTWAETKRAPRLFASVELRDI